MKLEMLGSVGLFKLFINHNLGRIDLVAQALGKISILGLVVT